MKTSMQKINQINLLVKRFYESKNIIAIQRFLKRWRIDDITQVLQEIDDLSVIIFALMAAEGQKTADLFKSFSDNLQSELIEHATNQQLKVILKNLYPDELLDLANGNKTHFKKILLCLTSEQRKMIKQISQFDSDEAGSIMNPEFISFRDEWSIQDCLKLFRKKYDKIEGNNTFFVTSSNNKLLGSVNIQNLLFADNYTKSVASLLDTTIIPVHPEDDVENVIDIFNDYSLDSIPVVDNDNKLIGIITDNDILPVMNDETTEDIYNMYGIQKLEESYIKASVWKIVKSRIFWVVILMVSATLTSIVINLFQNWGDVVTAGVSTAILVPIIPVITGTSGNTGSQAVASVIRSLAVGEVTPREYKIVFWKELRTGLLLGFILAVVNIARLAIYFAIPAFRPSIPSDLSYTVNNPYSLSIIISVASSIALWIAIILSKCLGALLPIIATRLKIDPTVMSAPLIATTLDVCSTSILFAVGIGIILLVVKVHPGQVVHHLNHLVSNAALFLPVKI